jgi:hypothetical protein
MLKRNEKYMYTFLLSKLISNKQRSIIFIIKYDQGKHFVF